MNQVLIETLRKEFTKELSVQTNWGRNQILSAFERSLSNATGKVLDAAGKSLK